MALRGTYLTLSLNGVEIAEAAEVSVKVKAKSLDITNQSDGHSASFMPGALKVGLAGRFLLASDASNWQTLYDLIGSGSEIDVILYRNSVEVLNGYGILKRLSKAGARSDDLITGAWGIRYYPTTATTEGLTLLTEAGVEITTEADVEITTE